MAGRLGMAHGLTDKALVWSLTCFVSVGVFLFGYDQGVMSGIITGPYFLDYFGHPSRASIGTMIAILEVGAFISSLAVGKIGDAIGRRKTIVYGSVIFVVGGALQTFATHFSLLIVGRVIGGLGIGLLTAVIPVYQSEISPPHSRGILASVEFSGNILGYSASLFADYGCSFIENDWSWRLPLLLQVVMGAVLALGGLVIPESPRWLLNHDKDEAGLVVIANLYGSGDIHNPTARAEFREIKMGILLARGEGEKGYFASIHRYGSRILIACSAQFFAQMNGINIVSYYFLYILESVGIVGRQAILTAGYNAILYLFATFIPWFVIDKAGRRPLLLGGAAFMALPLALVSYFLYLDTTWTPVAVICGIVFFNFVFGMSWGPVPWLYPSEILPLSVRAAGASLATSTNWAANWVVGEMTPILQESMGWRFYLLPCASCCISFVVVYFLYPETAGVTLEEMGSLFGDNSTTAGTPSIHAESGLMAGSPVASGRGVAAPGSIPNFALDDDDIDNRSQSQVQLGGGEDRSVGGWLARVVGRSGSQGSGSGSGRYAPINQVEEGRRHSSNARGYQED